MSENKEFNPEIELESIFHDAMNYGSLKESFLEHAANYGINNIAELLPNATNLNKTPALFEENDSEWVNEILQNVTKLPFARVKTMFLDLSDESLRAKGYTKGKKKLTDGQLAILQRITDPTTVYKTQKLDRDDVIDITDFDIVAWIKAAMKKKLDEEIARHILFGDGRLAGDDHISYTNIRPILRDDELYVSEWFSYTDFDDVDKVTNTLIDLIIRSRVEYKGSGTPNLYISEGALASMLMIKDKNDRRIYKDINELTSALRVKKIVTCHLFDTIGYSSPSSGAPVFAILVNPKDYAIGSNKGGALAMFDDFDIDYNQQKYLIEARLSGALTVPKSAIIITLDNGTNGPDNPGGVPTKNPTYWIPKRKLNTENDTKPSIEA